MACRSATTPSPDGDPHRDVVAVTVSFIDDAGSIDAGSIDAGSIDAGSKDTGSSDAEVAIVAIEGEVDLSAAPVLDDVFDALWVIGVSSVQVDARGVTFMDSRGFAVLERRALEAGMHNRRVSIVASSRAVDRLLALLGVHWLYDDGGPPAPPSGLRLYAHD